MSCAAIPSEDGKHYLINGIKLWCTNGPDADVIVVMAQTPIERNGKQSKQISTFIVEMNSPGIELIHRCKFMGLKGLSNGLIAFNNVQVPAENIIGKPGQGLKIALTTLNAGRLGIPAAAAGACKNFILEAERWVNERVQWGVPIGKHQHIAKKISNMAADTFAMQSLVDISCAFADRENADIRLEAAAAKYFCTETCWKVLDDFLQVRGGRGYETDTSLYERGDRPVSVNRIQRDMRVGRIFEGSSEVMHLIMAREALDKHFSLVMPLMMPKKGQKESKLTLIMNILKFYSVWYPKTWLPASTSFNTKHLSGPSQDHLAFVARNSKKLARSIFHTMAKFGPKLEFEQVILGNFVDIGVDLFVMAASLAKAEQLLAQNPSDKTPELLADLFCKNARVRIAQNFAAAKKNHNRDFAKVAKAIMEGKIRWIAKDVYGDVPVKYRDYAKNQYQAQGAEDLAASK